MQRNFWAGVVTVLGYGRSNSNRATHTLDEAQFGGRSPSLLRLLSDLFTPPVIAMATKVGPSAAEKEQVFDMAKQEMEYRVDLFNKLVQTCADKCVERKYKEAELNVGENSCIDRCVSKYWQVTGIVGQLLGSNKPPMG